jgi:hypothetical protein
VSISRRNIYHSGKNLYHSKVNFGQIVKDALENRSLIRAVAYVITTEAGDEKERGLGVVRLSDREMAAIEKEKKDMRSGKYISEKKLFELLTK